MDPVDAVATLMDRANNAEWRVAKLEKEKEKLKEKLRRIRRRLRELAELVGGAMMLMMMMIVMTLFECLPGKK